MLNQRKANIPPAKTAQKAEISIWVWIFLIEFQKIKNLEVKQSLAEIALESCTRDDFVKIRRLRFEKLLDGV